MKLKDLRKLPAGIVAVLLILSSNLCVAQNTKSTQSAKSTKAAEGQGKFPSTLTFGPKAGINFSHVEGLPDNEAKNNFTAGFLMIYSRWKHFGMSLDFMYSPKGAENEEVYTSEAGLIKESNSITLHYLEFPLLMNWYAFDPDFGFRPKLVFGPALGFLMKTAYTGNYNYDFDNIDLGIVIGTGFNSRIAKGTWFNLDFRYTHGFKDLEDDGRDISTRNLGLTAGIGFPIGK